MTKLLFSNSLILAILAAAVAIAITGLENLTHDLREHKLHQLQSRTLNEIIPNEQHDNILLDDVISVNDHDHLHLNEKHNIYVARKNGTITAFLIPTRAPDGYNGSIDSIVGIYLDGTIAGARVLQQHETAGLGDKIDIKKSSWILSFNGKSFHSVLPELWKVKKDNGVFDQFTGATITPRATTLSIFNALQYFHLHKDELIEKAMQAQHQQEITR